MRRHGPVVLAWLATIAIFLVGWSFHPPLLLLAQVSACILAMVSVRRTERTGDLRRPWVYRGALGLLLAATATVVVSAGSSVAFGSAGNPFVGFIALATLNVITAVLAWRAITKPAPRRAAIVGLIAVVAELFALIVDIIINMDSLQPSDFQIVAMFASFAATWAGALVCIAALLSFEPSSMYSVPNARVVDES